MLFLAALALVSTATDPVDFGRRDLDSALVHAGLGRAAVARTVRVTGRGPAESYSIRVSRRRIAIEARDAVGAMYGEFQMAERIRLARAKALRDGLQTGRPYLRDRGWNLFLTLPWDYVKNQADMDPAALTDPKRWYFQDDDYWRTLFDEMAHARLNWLDIHGTYDLNTTLFPNLWAYFIQSDKYPLIGVAKDVKARNLRQLNHVIDMAHARGVRVSLMCYEARAYTPHNPNPPYPTDEATMGDYTREVVEKAIRQIPKLDAIGFRIGESGHGESFFNCYLDAVKRSGKKIPLISRSWLTRKPQVVELARKCPDFTLQIKYNGEHWAAPYFVAGGRMAAWGSYSFEDYLSDSGTTEAARLWPGNVSLEGERWPDQPYKLVWQVRACGTNKIFINYQPDYVRRTIKSMKIGTASGYTVEPENAYYPASPLYYLRDPKNAYCRWIHQRDELYLDLWGRMGYDPNTPESAFAPKLREWFGRDASKMATAMKAASKVNLIASSAFNIGPDIRNHNIEMENGGTTEFFAQCEGFDTHSFMSPAEEQAIKATGGLDGRTTRNQAAALLHELSSAAPAGVVKGASGRAKEWDVSLTGLRDLAEFYAGRFAAASDWAGGDRLRADAQCGHAWSWWNALSMETFYKPFTERLRMHTHTFAWMSELRKMEPVPVALSGVGPWPGLLLTPREPIRATLTWSTAGDSVLCEVRGTDVAKAHILVKALPSTGYFHSMPMAKVGGKFVARFTRQNWGNLIAADITDGSQTARIPDWRIATPYLTIPARKGPTPRLYGPYEALYHFDPAKVDPAKYGPMIVCSRAAGFFTSPNDQKRKLLDVVERGGTLLILQDPYGSGAYSLDWLTPKPTIEGFASNVFDPGGALALPKITADGIMAQRFATCPGWEVFGNGGVAHLKLGKGDVWACQARVLNCLHVPATAKALLKLFQIGGSKPRIVVDAGSDGGSIYHSVAIFTNLMNAHDIPFLTLGEVVAKEQGMESSKVVPGRPSESDVLQGKGAREVVDLVVGKYLEAVSRPLPKTRAEQERRKPIGRKTVMKSLGLDPEPPRTPLNARITGVIRRKGYRIEKIVFESRPNFPVTGHIYVPDAAAGTKFPVIMNPHGHWTHKKMEPTVQFRLISQALHGYLAMIIDSPGWSWEDDNLVERRFAGTHWDFPLVVGSQNAHSEYVWDLIRAMDYLETRPDTDMSRVGITGASGGGMATLYAFAVDERYKCAVPVVYASSWEIGAEVHTTSGCECNYVPGIVRAGDRADILAIRAPAPVFCIGATVDGDFPPEGTRLTGKKLKAIWGLYGKADDASAKVYDGGHDYNKLMRQDAMGFFDKYLLGKGDGSPVPEADIKTEDPSDPQFLAMPEVPQGLRTLRDLAKEALSAAKSGSFEDVVALNGGIPSRGPLNWRVAARLPDGESLVTCQSERGLTIPGILWMPKGKPVAGMVLVSDGGKAAAADEFGVESLVARGVACLAIDVRGFGELDGMRIRPMVYMGVSVPFTQAVDVLAAVDGLRKLAPSIGVVGRGVCSAQAAMYAGLIDPEIPCVAGLQGLKGWENCFDAGVNVLAIQPGANYGATLERLRSLLNGRTVWSFRGEQDPEDWANRLGL